MDWEVWGTYSVGDHLRRRAFVADVLLYDRLVIPTPPYEDEAERQRWVGMGWRPERQGRLIGRLGRDRVVQVPWNEDHRRDWEEKYRAAPAGARGAIRSRIAAAASRDMAAIVDAQDEVRRRGGQDWEVDQAAHYATRLYLVDYTNKARDIRNFAGLPPVEVYAVAAYGSYRSLRQDMQIVPPTQDEERPNLAMFGWEFFVPGDATISDDDALSQALDLAELDEAKRYRRAMHRWLRQSITSEATAREAVAEMEELVREYRAAVRRIRFLTILKYAFAILGIGAEVASVVLPPVGLVGGFAGVGCLATERAKSEPAARLEAAAMFYDARKRFGWR